MKIEILKRTPNELRFEVEGVGHAFCNVLQKNLLEDKKVDLAGYDIPHPLASHPIIYVRTKGKATPGEALSKAVQRALKINKDFTEELNKTL
jgi:DNA-directed RNA polymerase subunit L